MSERNETPILTTADVPATISFYTDKLGFRVSDTKTRAGIVDWVRLESDESSIIFTAETAKPQRIGRRQKMYQYTVKNISDLWERLQDQVDVTWLLESADSGVREFSIRDCNGYIINFSNS